MLKFKTLRHTGYQRRGGLDPNGSAVFKILERQRCKEENRGEHFARAVADIFGRIRTDILMPKATSDDDDMFYPLSVILKQRDVKFLLLDERVRPPRSSNLTRSEAYQFVVDRDTYCTPGLLGPRQAKQYSLRVLCAILRAQVTHKEF